MSRSKWPVQYRLTYKLPRDFTWSYKYVHSTTDEQAIDSFYEIFEHLRDHYGKPDDPLPVMKRIEKHNSYNDTWQDVPFKR